MNISLSQANNKQTSIIQVPGYIIKLVINYGLYSLDKNNSLLIWNVQGTKHNFNIDLRVVIQNHNYDYDSHFILTLQKLRQDIIDWLKQEEDKKDASDWQFKYYNDFKNMIDFYSEIKLNI